MSAVRMKDQVVEETSLTSKEELKLKNITFDIPSTCGIISMQILLDAVLAGHEGLVSEVCWSRATLNGNYENNIIYLELLACSLSVVVEFTIVSLFMLE